MRILTTVAALSLGTALAAEPVRVVTGTAPTQGLAARVMQGIAVPSMTLPVGADPHHHSLRPSEARVLQDAQLVVWIGERHTPWLEGPIEKLAGNARVLELMEVEGLHTHSFGDIHHGGHADHHGAHGGDVSHGDHTDDHAGEAGHGDHGDGDAHGDDHAGGHGEGHGHHHHDGIDTHAWLDPDNAILWMQAIAATLSEVDPDNDAAYQANAAAGAAEIRAATADAKARIATLGEVHLVTAHDAWNYFAEAFGVEIIGAIGDGHANPPGAARISELRESVAAHDHVCVLTERTTAPGFVDALGADADAAAEPNSMLSEIGPDFYPALLNEVVSGLEVCFE